MEKIIANYKTVFSKWGDFNGRSRRSEFWYFAITNFVISAVFIILDKLIFGGSSEI